jgi:hypothetical protein
VETTIAISKVCNACGLDKPLTEFTPNRGGRLGTTPKCKPCRSRHESYLRLSRMQRRAVAP